MAALTIVGAVVASVTLSGATSPAFASESVSAPISNFETVPGCSTTVLKNDRKWQLDTWQVGMSCWSNTSDRTLYVRGVLDVPGALDGHTPWVEIRPNTQLTVPAKQVISSETTSPWGEPSSRIEEYKCPPVVIGECSPFNNKNEAVLAFATLLTNLF